MILSIILAVILVYCAYLVFRRPANFPPGPFCLPIIGYLPNFGIPLTKQFSRLAEKYGDVVSIQLGSHRVVILSSLEMIRNAFKEDALSGRADFEFLRERSEDKKGILFSDGENWRELRRFTLRNLRDFGFGKSSLEGIIHAEINDLLDNLSKQTDQEITLANRFNLAVVNALWTITTGNRFSHDDPKSLEAVQRISGVVSDADVRVIFGQFFPIFQKLQSYKRMINNAYVNIEKNKQMIMRVIEEHENDHVAGDESDLIHLFLEKMKTADPKSDIYGSNGHANLKLVLLDLFAAGVETTSTTLLWIFLLLALHPEIQEKIQQEIDSVVSRNEMPSLEHRSQLSYTEAVIMESSRFVTLVPLGVAHTANKEIKFNGYTIPEGTVLLANLYGVHHDPRYWEKPMEFLPERFLHSDGTLKTSDAFIPFSVGKRACLGESLAKIELFLFVTAFLQRFSLELPPNKLPSLEPNTGPISVPKPYQVILRIRK